MALIVGIVGKPSSGKSTFLNAACLTNAKVSEIPFTTINPNKGIAYVKSKCVCEELEIDDDPKNSLCINGVRFIPINLLDVAGLVPDAHKGKGLGNKFLNDLSRADLLIHIVDITGSLNKSGQRIKAGENDPYEDIEFLENEIDLWFKEIIEREDWSKFTRTQSKDNRNFVKALTDRLSGLKINVKQIKMVLNDLNLLNKDPKNWEKNDLLKFSECLRKIAKPIIIVANKIDKEISEKNLKELKKKYKSKIIPCSALAEYLLKKYNEENIIDYIPGNNYFEIKEPNKLNTKEKNTLVKIRTEILEKYNGTGVQEVFEYALFNVLNQICVYPVSDINNYSDNKGNVLPDVFLIKKGTTLRDFINDNIHSELADNFIYGINARTKRRLGEDYILNHNDIIRIVASK